MTCKLHHPIQQPPETRGDLALEMWLEQLKIFLILFKFNEFKCIQLDIWQWPSCCKVILQKLKPQQAIPLGRGALKDMEMLPKILPELEKDQEVVPDISHLHHHSPLSNFLPGLPISGIQQAADSRSQLPWLGHRQSRKRGASFKGACSEEGGTQNGNELQNTHRHTRFSR